nr:phage portal protein [Paenibacillus flagellatus]
MREIVKIIQDGAASAMTLEQIIQNEISRWQSSEEYRLMTESDQYYRNKTAILKRERTVIDKTGRRVRATNLADIRLVNGFYRKLVDQKVGYLLAKRMSVQTDNKQYLELLSGYFGQAMQQLMQSVGREAIKKGIAWLHVYYDDEGRLSFKRMRSQEIIPFWRDEAHTELDAVIRVYKVEAYEGVNRSDVTKVEWWDQNGIRRYVLDGRLIPDVDAGEESSHLLLVENDGTEKPFNWKRVPFIPVKYNEEEQSLLDLIKTLVDDYDARKSDNANNLEDLPNSIYVVKDYGGTTAEEFRENINRYRVVFTEGEGGVTTVSLEINTEAYTAHQAQNRKDIYEFGRGVDTQSERIGSSPSGIALKFLYADLDMDANTIETEFQVSLEKLRWFIDVHIANATGTDYSAEKVDFIFNRDIPINETDTINNIKSSSGIISNETLVANHPFVTDVQAELERLKKEREADPDPYATPGSADSEGDEE